MLMDYQTTITEKAAKLDLLLEAAHSFYEDNEDERSGHIYRLFIQYGMSDDFKQRVEVTIRGEFSATYSIVLYDGEFDVYSFARGVEDDIRHYLEDASVDPYGNVDDCTDASADAFVTSEDVEEL
jgi:hypothetical protein